ncbi:MAG TPA: hypothetical protein PLX89_21205 [Verrucomicrobiota bacterium]|nr:hypothetical protein [Verrucomicrobiota bacterium]
MIHQSYPSALDAGGLTHFLGRFVPIPASLRLRHLLGTVCCLVLSALPMSTVAQPSTILKSFGELTNLTGLSPGSTLVQAEDATLFGTTSVGQRSVSGTIYSIQPDGSHFSVVRQFLRASDGTDLSPGVVVDDGVLYGTANRGGNLSVGTLYRLTVDGRDFRVLKHFDRKDGAFPRSRPTLSGGLIYGTTELGGSSDEGVLFRANTDGSGLTVLKHFKAAQGKNPYSPVIVFDGVVYGTTLNGGTRNGGVIFRIGTNGADFGVLKDLGDADGVGPLGGLTMFDGVLFGTTTRGGTNGYGTVFRLNPDGSDFAVLKHFGQVDGFRPTGQLAVREDGLWGTTRHGDPLGESDIFRSPGTVFRINLDGSEFRVLKQFSGTDGAFPNAGVILTDRGLFGTTTGGGDSQQGTIFRMSENGDSHTILKSFTGIDPANPRAGLALAEGVLYGSTSAGGRSREPGSGTIFRVATDGSGYATLRDFTGPDGAAPSARLLVLDGQLYGTTQTGGDADLGTLFRMGIDGAGFSVLKHFDGPDGQYPAAPLIHSAGVLYGTIPHGGHTGVGVIFKILTNGTGFSVIKHFEGTDGANPRSSVVLLGDKLYGTTEFGGTLNAGTVYRISTNGSDHVVLKEFENTDGRQPWAGLTPIGDTLYGTTLDGGRFRFGTIFRIQADGTGFEVLRHLDWEAGDGPRPDSELTVVGDRLIGSTEAGGLFGTGTVFEMRLDGKGYRTLRDFHYSGNGAKNPVGGVVIEGGRLYGAAYKGGEADLGVVYTMSLPERSGLAIRGIDEAVVVTWTDSTSILQEARQVTGDYTTITGAISPYTNAVSHEAKFFRLQSN